MPTSKVRSKLVSFCALACCVFFFAAVLTFDPGDWPSPNRYPHHSPPVNACGAVGAWWAYHFHYWLGDGSYPLLLFVTLAALIRLIRDEITGLWERAAGAALLVACTAASVHLISAPAAGPLPVGHGGVIGYALGNLLRQHVDRLGTVIVLTAVLVIGLTFVTQGHVLKWPALLGRALRARGGKPRGSDRVRSPSRMETSETLSTFDVRHRDRTLLLRRRGKPADETGEVGAPPDGRVSEPPERARSAATRKKRPADPVVKFLAPRRKAPSEPEPKRTKQWRLPSLELLHEPQYGFDVQLEQTVRKQAKVLEQTLEDFRIDAHVVEIDTGPVITMFELRLGAGIKVSSIATLSNDIARALRAPAIRVVAPISGKNTVGIEVPNAEKEKVRLRELLTRAGKRAAAMHLPLFLGKDAAGSALVADLTAMPHLLIAGTTGSGKSVSLNAVIFSLLMTRRPDQVKLILLDPKMVEFNRFKDVPHLMCPVVSDMPRAQKMLQWAVTQMNERYELLAETRVRDVATYNQLGSDEIMARLDVETEREKAGIATRLPYIVIVIDELADLMITSAKEVEHHLCRLAQKSRAVGIHMIVATQRPEAKIVTGLIKSNLPSRICFRVASRIDSRIVLDQNGGEVLLGQGDMLFLPPASHKLIRAQGTFLEESEIHAVLHDLASRGKPEFHPELVGVPTAEAAGFGDYRDPLFHRAVRIILQSKRGSASLLQRRLTIGYSRASRLIEQMAETGIVGDYKGSQAREVLISPAQWEALAGRFEGPKASPTTSDAGTQTDTFPDAVSQRREPLAATPRPGRVVPDD